MAKIVQLCCLAALFTSATLYAQSATGSILGTVTDPTGSRVAAATVEVVNEATGFTRVTTSGNTGEYEFVALPIGVYTVRCSAPGFKRSESRGNVLQVEQRARTDFQLAVGE